MTDKKDKSGWDIAEFIKVLIGPGALTVLHNFIGTIVKGLLGEEGTSGRITASTTLSIIIIFLIIAYDLHNDKKISTAGRIGVALTIIALVISVHWALQHPSLSPTPTTSLTPSPTITLLPSSTAPETSTPPATPSPLPISFTQSPPPLPTPTLWGGGRRQIVFNAFAANSRSDYEIFLLSLPADLQTLTADDVESSLANLSNNLAPDEDPTWAPDGTRIAFVSRRDQNPEIYVMDAKGGHQENITRHDDRDYEPAWSPNGMYIAFSSYRGAGAQQDIFFMTSNGETPQQISTTGWHYQQPTWGADSETIFYIKNTPDKNASEIVSYNITTGEQATITHRGKKTFSPDISPDGKWIIFTSSYGGFQNLWQVGIDGYNLKQLTDQIATQYADPVWSPDGKWIAFVSEGSPSNTLCIYELATGNIYNILSMPGLSSPSWRP